MAISEFSAALKQVCSERGISEESVLESIKTALVAAYRKDYGGELETLSAQISPETGELRVFDGEKDVTPAGFGRIAAQTAKQVILQQIRESEKVSIMAEYQEKVGSIANGHVFRVEKNLVIVNLGKIQGIMPPQEQIPGENYQPNSRIRVLIKEVKEGIRGPEVLASRADPDLVKELFALEVPEINSGTVKINAVAREAGSRTKIAVSSTEENVDPVGSCVGQKGTRVQAVIAEIGSEKIDIVNFSESPDKFIASSLSPAKVIDVILNKKTKEAKVIVPEDQLSLAIGKEGQNVRLAVKLTGWKLDIKTPGSEDGRQNTDDRLKKAEDGRQLPDNKEKDELKDAGLSTRTVKALQVAGINSLEELRSKSLEEIRELKGVGPKTQEEISKLL